MLLHKANIIGGEGRLGRNNVIFTLSLAYYSSGYALDTCEYNMFAFNERLQEPLTEAELVKIVRSAYSGNYQAASREFIIELCQQWVSPTLKIMTCSFNDVAGGNLKNHEIKENIVIKMNGKKIYWLI